MLGLIFFNPNDTVNVRVVKQNPKFDKEKEINIGESVDLWYE